MKRSPLIILVCFFCFCFLILGGALYHFEHHTPYAIFYRVVVVQTGDVGDGNTVIRGRIRSRADLDKIRAMIEAMPDNKGGRVLITGITKLD